MTEIQQNRYDQLVRRVNNIVSPGSMVNDALNELFPVLEVESLNAELGLLSTWRLGFSSTKQLALAANVNISQLFNPVDSGQLVVLERVDFKTVTAMDIEYVVTDVALTNLTANHALRDTRTGIVTQPVAQARDVQQMASLAQFGLFWVEGDVNFTMQDKRGLFVLAPGTGVSFGTTVTNTGSQISFQWRERLAQAAELNF